MKGTRKELMVCQFQGGTNVHMELFDNIEKARRRKSALMKQAREKGKQWETTLETNLR